MHTHKMIKIKEKKNTQKTNSSNGIGRNDFLPVITTKLGCYFFSGIVTGLTNN